MVGWCSKFLKVGSGALGSESVGSGPVGSGLVGSGAMGEMGAGAMVDVLGKVQWAQSRSERCSTISACQSLEFAPQ